MTAAVIGLAVVILYGAFAFRRSGRKDPRVMSEREAADRLRPNSQCVEFSPIEPPNVGTEE